MRLTLSLLTAMLLAPSPMAETDQTVSQIADACGYPTPAHFQRQFHRHQKRSPLLYRSAVRKQG